MRRYELWDRTSPINNTEASYFLNNKPFKDYSSDIILIYAENSDKVVQIECKDILASVYSINRNLPLDEFMTQYFSIIEKTEK